jgi:hypothetical protein
MRERLITFEPPVDDYPCIAIRVFTDTCTRIAYVEVTPAEQAALAGDAQAQVAFATGLQPLIRQALGGPPDVSAAPLNGA